MEIDTSKIYDEALKDIPEELLKVPPMTEEEDDNELAYAEYELLETLEDDFEYQIKKRGKEYYECDNILKVIKTEKDDRIIYTAKVCGTAEKPYEVKFELDESGIEYSCSCPCTYSCKHEYAVLMAIDNQEYELRKLKPAIKEKDINIKSIIQLIPAEELKKYILTKDGFNFNTKDFENKFRKYYPKQKYEYYYNNLYNAILFEDDYEELIETYFGRIKQYISCNDFQEVFKIIKSIINSYIDSENLNIDEYFTDILPNIGMFLRVAYRKANDEIRNQINIWMDELENNDFYHNYYLEDLILNVDKTR